MMAGIDESRVFVPVQIAILTVSDTRDETTDLSGPLLAQRAVSAGHRVLDRAIVPDELPAIIAQLNLWIDESEIDVIIATGGTGLTGRDVTPEAVETVCDKSIPGFGELFRWIGFGKIGTSTIQSRACAGVSKGTYVFSVPGSRGACADAWDEILVHQLDVRYQPCNFVEIIPRLEES